MQPKAGDLLLITDRASIQFVACKPFLFTVIRPHDWTTYQGWIWLDGYQLDATGVAKDRRSIFVQLSGLVLVRRNQTDVRARPRIRHRTYSAPHLNTRPSAGRTRQRSYIEVEPDRP